MQRNPVSVAPPGLSDGNPTPDPGLAPWAIVSRPSGTDTPSDTTGTGGDRVATVFLATDRAVIELPPQSPFLSAPAVNWCGLTVAAGLTIVLALLSLRQPRRRWLLVFSATSMLTVVAVCLLVFWAGPCEQSSAQERKWQHGAPVTRCNSKYDPPSPLPLCREAGEGS